MTSHHRPLHQNISIRTVAEREVVVVADWKSHIETYWLTKMGKPERPTMKDLWIVAADYVDAQDIARCINLGFDFVPMSRGRAPTFGEWNHNIPADVSVYYSASTRIDDDAEIQRLYPGPERLVCRVERKGLRYHVQSMSRHQDIPVRYDVVDFSKAIGKAYAAILATQGEGFDTRREDLNGSPVLAAVLGMLVRPAAELVSHWLRGVGNVVTEQLVISPLSFRSDFPIGKLLLHTRGANRRACFMLDVGDYVLADEYLSNLVLPQTAGTAFAAMAEQGELMLSQIVDLPGADRIRVTRMEESFGRWTARLDPVGVTIDPPVSTIPFTRPDYLTEVDEAGYVVRNDVIEILRPLLKEQVSYILHEILDGSSGSRLDVSAWMPVDMPTEISVENKVFKRIASSSVRPSEIFRKAA